MLIKKPQHYLLYTSALISFCWLITAMYLPALPTIMQHFGLQDTGIQIMIAAYFIAFCISQFYWGPIADRYPRQSIILLTLSLSLVGSIVCSISPYFWLFVMGRIIQGFGIGALPALARAIIHEQFEHAILLRFMVYLTSLVAVITALAPLFGAMISQHFHWQAIFVTQSLINMILILWNRFGFNNKINYFKKINQKIIQKDKPRIYFFHTYKKIFSHPIIVFHLTTYTLMMGSLVAFYSASPFLFIEQCHLSAEAYGGLIVGASVFYLMAVLVVRLLIHQLTAAKLLLIGFVISFIGAVLFMLCAVYAQNLWILAPLAIYLFGAAFIPPITNTAAMEALPEYASTISALLGAALALGSGALSYVLIDLVLASWVYLGGFFVLTSAGLLIYFLCLNNKNDNKNGSKRINLDF
jgi:MFS family permease